MHECAELVSKLGRRKSQEALFCLAEDFQTIKNAFGQHLQGQDGTEENRVALLPADHSMAAIVAWEYLDRYLEAHGGLANEAIMWCKRYPEYPLRLHRALLDYILQGAQKQQVAARLELEAYYASYVADETAVSPGRH